jgi:O-methyltransferase
VSRKEVEAHFRHYGLLDDQVRFLPGWFDDTLKTFPGTALAMLRIDCDLYGSTITVLTELYDRVPRGGYVIVDDYGAIPACRLAVEEFRRARRISDPIVEIDYTGIYWIKT